MTSGPLYIICTVETLLSKKLILGLKMFEHSTKINEDQSVISTT